MGIGAFMRMIMPVVMRMVIGLGVAMAVIVRMLFLLRVVMVMAVAMTMRVIILFRLVMVVRMIVLFRMPVIIIIMAAEDRVFAEVMGHHAVKRDEFEDLRVARQRFDRFFQPGCQVMADPNHEIGLFQRGRLGRAHGMTMGRCARRQDQGGFADARHDARHQRMDGRDVDGDAGAVMGHGGGRQRQRDDKTQGKPGMHENLALWYNVPVLICDSVGSIKTEIRERAKDGFRRVLSP